MTTDATIEEASAAFNEAAAPTAKDYADAIAEYAQLKDAPHIVGDRRAIERLRALIERDGYLDIEGLGRVNVSIPDERTYANRKEGLNAFIKRGLAGHKDGLHVEGVGRAYLRPSKHVWYDVKAIFANRPDLFDEMLAMPGNVLSVDKKMVEATVATGGLMGINAPGLRNEGEATPSLIIEAARP